MRPSRRLLLVVAALATLSVAACGAGTTPTPSAAAPGASSGGGVTIDLTAKSIEFDKATISAPAGQPFTIHFSNQDQAVPHNVRIEDANGTIRFDGKVITGVDSIDYTIPALPAGTYKFMCKIHSNMVGTLTVGP